VICGDGPLAGELHAQAAGDPRVIFTGFREDPRPIYAAADVMALASWEEGFGQVLLESACAGVPAVVVADAGLGSTVEGWGEEAEAPAQTAIAAAIARAAQRPREEARRWAEARGPDAWARAHLAVLERAIRA
jgi:glycosyltransferase involved in cell wall biosynthesis